MAAVSEIMVSPVNKTGREVSKPKVQIGSQLKSMTYGEKMEKFRIKMNK
jgi:hypothetical protein